MNTPAPTTPPAPAVGLVSGEAAQELFQIIDQMRAHRQRTIYITDAHDYFITYRGGGPFSKQLIQHLVAAGVLVETYPGHVGCYSLPPRPSGPSAGVGETFNTIK